MKFRTGGQTGVDRAVLDFCLGNKEEYVVGVRQEGRQRMEQSQIIIHWMTRKELVTEKEPKRMFGTVTEP